MHCLEQGDNLTVFLNVLFLWKQAHLPKHYKGVVTPSTVVVSDCTYNCHLEEHKLMVVVVLVAFSLDVFPDKAMQDKTATRSKQDFVAFLHE
jgi:hypothetical protein